MVISNQPLQTAGGTQQALFVNEDGLYDVILDSRKQKARAFRKWVTSDVLPAIRKTGGYMVAKADETPEEIMARALQVANATLARRDERIRALEQETQAQAVELETKTERIAIQDKTIKESAPKVEYYNQVLQSVTSCTTTQVGNMIGMGGRELNKRLKAVGLIYRQSGQYLLHAPYNAWRLHTTRTQSYTRSDGSIGTTMYTVWTQRGVRLIIALSQNEWNVKRALAAINGEQAEEQSTVSATI